MHAKLAPLLADDIYLLLFFLFCDKTPTTSSVSFCNIRANSDYIVSRLERVESSNFSSFHIA